MLKKKFIYTLFSLCMVLAVLPAAPFTAQAAESDETVINLSDSGITVDGNAISTNSSDSVYAGADIIYYKEGQGSSYGEGATADEHSAAEAAKHTVVTITQPGTYRVSGKLSAGQLAIDLGSDAKDDPNAVVNIILDGANITCTVAPAVIFYNVWESESSDSAGANVTLADGSENTINGSYVARIYKEGTTSKLHKYDGAFYSKMSMIIDGETNNTGKLNITATNEGLDSEMHLTINGGNLAITAQNDGINANEDDTSIVTINDGYLYVDAGKGVEGDGIDSNGYLTINGGTIVSLANGTSGDGGIDANNEISINGGTVVALGSRNDSTSASSTQPYMELSYATTKAAGSLIRITDSQNNEILSFNPAKAYQSLTYSSDVLALNTVYSVYSGGTITDADETNGLYELGGAYSGGTQQQYTGNSSMGPGMGGNGTETRPEMPDTTGTAPDFDTGTPPEMPVGTETGSTNDVASAEFTLSTDVHTFSNVTDYTLASNKTAVSFKVNDNNIIENVSNGGKIAIDYAGAFLTNGNSVNIPASDIQFTITDSPSEDYAASFFLSEGEDKLAEIIPTEPGTYILTIAVVGTNETYTGSNQWKFTISTEDASQLPFTDVNEDENNEWYYDSIQYVYQHNIMNGTTSTKFSPDTTLSRAMLATILGRMSGAAVDQNTSTTFTDVVKDNWSNGYIAWAKANGIMSGYSNTIFGQYDKVTREQMCLAIVNYAKYAGIDLTATTNSVTFSDTNDISPSALNAVTVCQQAGIIKGSSNNRFNPKSELSRAQAAVILARLLQEA